MNPIGEFDPHLRPLVRLSLRDENGDEQTVEARLDTGFDLYLAVPEWVITALHLPFVKVRSMRLADSSIESFAEYRARLLWEGLERPIRVLAKPGVALAGIALFSGYRLLLEVIDGGSILCDALD